MVVDFIIAAIVLIAALIKARVGLYNSLASIVVIVLAIAIGMSGSKILLEPVSEYVWQKTGDKIAEGLDKKIELHITGEDGAAGDFKEGWNKTVESLGLGQLKGLQMKNDGAYEKSDLLSKLKLVALANSRLLVYKITGIVLFVIISLLSLFVLRVVAKALGKITELPVIGWIDHGGGFVLGFIEILVLMLLVVRGAGLLRIGFFEKLSEGTLILKWLCGGDLQTALDSIKGLSFDDLHGLDLEELKRFDFSDISSRIGDFVKNIDIDHILNK